jgi:hypothetical protein
MDLARGRGAISLSSNSRFPGDARWALYSLAGLLLNPVMNDRSCLPDTIGRTRV